MGVTCTVLLVDSCWLLAVHCMFRVFGLPPVAVARSSAFSPTQMVLSVFKESCNGDSIVTFMWAVSTKKVEVSFSITLYDVVVVRSVIVVFFYKTKDL